jgi:hypothetical protein
MALNPAYGDTWPDSVAGSALKKLTETNLTFGCLEQVKTAKQSTLQRVTIPPQLMTGKQGAPVLLVAVATPPRLTPTPTSHLATYFPCDYPTTDES